MEDIVALTSLSTDTLIRVKVRAMNDKEWGSYSELNVVGALIENKPSKMIAPTFDL